MSLNYIKSLFPDYQPGKYHPRKATQRGFVHKINPTYKPPRADITPAQWHRARRAHKAKHIHGKMYECPICQRSMNKFSWCETDQRWSIPTIT